MPYKIFKYVFKVTRESIFPEDLVSSKREFILIYFLRLFFLVGRRLLRDRCPRQAAALAYQTFLSLVPLLFIIMAIAGALNLDGYIKYLIDIIEHNLLPNAAKSAAAYVSDIALSIHPKSLGLAGAGGFIVVGIALFFTLDQMVNDIFRCKKNRPFIMRIIFYLLLLITVPLMLGVSVYYSGQSVFYSLPLTRYLLSACFTVGSLFLVYWFLPHTKLQKKYTFIASLFTGIALELAKLGFAIYAKYLGETLSYVYGTLAIIPLFMIWIYLLWLIFLFGAELNAALHEVRQYDRFIKPKL
ncbi:MAG: YihY/virulence factor BrkB family protein [Deltaproteobacteria bacterium]|nr:YihY/virulence factor BrkB family protein [Deltaproteobacteria bacterium]